MWSKNNTIMKKLLVLVICLLMTGSIYAQKHLTFKGVPIDGTLKEYTEAMVNAGFTFEETENGVSTLSGDFAGYKDCQIKVSTLKNCDIVSHVDVFFSSSINWSPILNDYEKLKGMLTKKYGKSTKCIERFSRPADSDGSKMRALLNDECEWYTTFSNEYGEIKVSIVKGRFVIDGRVCISYYDKVNSNIVNQAAMDDL